MPRDLVVGLRLTADGKGFVGEVRVAAKELDRLTGRSDRLKSSTRKLSSETDGLRRTVSRAHSRILQYGVSLIAVHQTIAAARGLARYADQHTSISNAVRLSTSSAVEFAQVQEGLFLVAQRTRAPLAAVADLYQKLSISAGELGASQQDLLAVIEGVGQALVINGTSAAQSSGALLQLSQALGGGVVRAEEFNSLLDGAKPLLISVANNLDAAGGSVSRLRELVGEGEVSSRAFFSALQAGLPELAANFEATESTIGQSLVRIDNAMTRLIGGVDTATGASAALARGFSAAADVLATDSLASGLATAARALDDIAVAAGAVAVVRLLPVLSGWGAASVSTRREMIRMRRQLQLTTPQVRIHAAALRGAAVAARGFRGALALVGGPLGLVVAGAASAIYALTTASDTAAESARGLEDALGFDVDTTSLDAVIEKLRDLTEAQRSALVLNLEKRLNETSIFGFGDDGLREQLADAEARLAQINANNVGPQRDRRVATSQHERYTPAQAEVDRLRKALAAEENRIALLRQASQRLSAKNPPSGGGTGPPVTPSPDADQQIAAIAQRSNDTIARLTLDRIALVDRAERRQIEEIAALKGLSGQQEQARQEAIVAVQQAASISRRKIQHEEESDRIRASVDDEQRQRESEQRRREAEQRISAGRMSALHEIRSVHGTELQIRRAAIAQWAAEQTQALAAAHATEAEWAELTRALREEYNRAFLDELRRTQEEAAEILRAAREQELLEARGFRSQTIADEAAHEKQVVGLRHQQTPKIRRIAQGLVDVEKKTGVQRVQAGLEVARESFGNFAQYSEKAFRLQQVAGVAQAIVSTATGVAKALEKGFPIGLIEAALIGAAGAAQIASIRSQQPPRAYARGGVVDSPTYFSARGVPRGVAGEAGPEAILPLRRGRNGQLGVQMQGDRGGTEITVAPVIQVTVTPAAGAGPGETGAEVAARVRDQLIPIIISTIVDQSRPGGVLAPLDRVS